MNRTKRSPQKRAPVLAKALPVGLAVAAYGLSYGVLAVAAGLSPAFAVFSSVLVLAGGSQFAFVGVIAAGGNPMTGAISGLLLNLRYLAFGAAIAPHLPAGSLVRRLTDSYLVVDESVALALGVEDGEVARRFRVAGATVVTGWIAATALGAYGGALIGDPEAFGLDAAFPAGFLALLAPFLRTRAGRVAAGVGALLAVSLIPIAPPGVPILAAGLGAVLAMRLREPTAADAADRLGTRELDAIAPGAADLTGDPAGADSREGTSAVQDAHASEGTQPADEANRTDSADEAEGADGADQADTSGPGPTSTPRDGDSSSHGGTSPPGADR